MRFQHTNFILTKRQQCGESMAGEQQVNAETILLILIIAAPATLAALVDI